MDPNGVDRHARFGRSILRFTSAQQHARIGIIPEHGNARRLGGEFQEDFEPLGAQFRRQQ